MFNFVIPDQAKCYRPVLDLFITNIMRNRPFTSKISNESVEDCLNIHFFHEYEQDFKGKINVFIPHGIADKGYRNVEQTDKFDFVFVSGPLWKEKLIKQGMNPNKIIIGGYPKIDHLFGMPQRRNTILWAPTHDRNRFEDGSMVTTYPKLCEDLLKHDFISELKGTALTVHLSSHPANNFCNKPTNYMLLDAAVVIADSGSTWYEAASLDIPVVCMDYLVAKGIMNSYPDTFEYQIYNERIGYHIDSALDLPRLFRSIATDGATQKTIEFIEGIFPKKLRGLSGEKICWHLNVIEADM